ncbi:MAG: hypothetical protein WDM77_13475 [Steroidobacteraceae bacterium]
MTTDSDNDRCVSSNATAAPPTDSGSAERMVSGWKTRANSSTSTANTIMMPVPIARPKAGQQFRGQLRVTGFNFPHTRRQVLHGWQGIDLLDGRA